MVEPPITNHKYVVFSFNGGSPGASRFPLRKKAKHHGVNFSGLPLKESLTKLLLPTT